MSDPQAAVVAAPAKPVTKPLRPEFSSGPCAKRPGWTAEAVAARAFLGRSHRAAKPKAQLKDAIDRTARVLGVPADYRIGIVPALRHRRLRDGDVVDARRAAASTCWPGRASAKAGSPTRSSS